MLGITEKDVQRCRKILKTKLLKNLDTTGMIVNEIEICSPDEEKEDPEGSCCIKWDIDFVPEDQ